MKARPTVFVVAIVAGLLVGIPAPSEANVITKSDGNDTKGPLDLAGVKVSHKGAASVFKITTIGAFSNADVALKSGAVNGLFEVALDTNADKRFNFYVDLFYASGHFRGVIYTRSGDVISYHLKAARVSKRSMKVSVPHGLFPNKGSYDFAIFSAYFGAPCTKKTPCVDVIPNRYPLIRHDFTPPTAKWGVFPYYSSNVSATLSVPLSFTVHDDPFGSGVKHWSLQRKALGTVGWQVIQTGKGLSPTVIVVGEQGTTYLLRIVSVDRQKNRSATSPKKMSMPFDDRHAAIQYSAPPTQNDAADGAFLSTTSSIANSETATITFDSRLESFCVLGGPTTGGTASATVSLNGSDLGLVVEDGATAPRAALVCGPTTTTKPNTVVITSTSAEPFVFDGLAAAFR